MAITINGSGSISGISSGGYPDGSITAADLASTLDLSSKTLTLPAGAGGKILQIVSSGNHTTNDSTTSGGGNVVDSTLSATITPTTSTSKIIAFMTLMTYHGSQGMNGIARIKRTGPSTVYSGFVQDWYHPTGAGVSGNISLIFRDAPGSTAQCSYTAQFGYYGASSGSSVIQLNKDYASNVNGQSHILLLEFA